MMIGYTENNRGRFKCNYCDHATYKTHGGAQAHRDHHHQLEAELERKDSEIERLKNKPPKVVEKVVTKERVVYKDKPDPKYWYVRNHGMEGIYCTACKQVQTGVGIPYGQTIENTPHQCGNRTLLPVVEVR